MYKNAHGHKQRNTKTGTASPVPELVSKYVKCNLTNTQISDLLSVNYPTASMATNQLSTLINCARQKASSEIVLL